VSPGTRAAQRHPPLPGPSPTALLCRGTALPVLALGPCSGRQQPCSGGKDRATRRGVRSAVVRQILRPVTQPGVCWGSQAGFLREEPARSLRWGRRGSRSPCPISSSGGMLGEQGDAKEEEEEGQPWPSRCCQQRVLSPCRNFLRNTDFFSGQH